MLCFSTAFEDERVKMVRWTEKSFTEVLADGDRHVAMRHLRVHSDEFHSINWSVVVLLLLSVLSLSLFECQGNPHHTLTLKGGVRSVRHHLSRGCGCTYHPPGVHCRHTAQGR
jgi:hypothetical protein